MPETLRIDEMRKNGVSCLMLGNDGKTVYGFRVLNQPPRISPRERYESITIPGRSGSLTLTEGDEVHDNITLSCTAYIESAFYEKENPTSHRMETHNRIAEITQWISGEGKYEFYGHPDGYYKGRLANQMSFDRIVQGNPHKAFTLQFDCQPYFYLNAGDETEKNITETTHWVTNIANEPSKPLIKLYGSGDGTIMTQGLNTMRVNIDPNIGHLIIDSEAEIAYTEDGYGNKTIASTRVSGDYFRIPAASTSSIMISGGITSYELTPRWRQK